MLPDCHVAALVRSSLLPSDNVTRAVSCDRAPASVKLDVPFTATLEMVGAAGVVGAVGVGGAGETGVGAVGALLLFEHPAAAKTVRQTTTLNAARPMRGGQQEAIRLFRYFDAHADAWRRPDTPRIGDPLAHLWRIGVFRSAGACEYLRDGVGQCGNQA